jgi:hypothetical protein
MHEQAPRPEMLVHQDFTEFVADHHMRASRWLLATDEQLEPYSWVQFFVTDPSKDGYEEEAVLYELHFGSQFRLPDGTKGERIKGFQIVTSADESGFSYVMGEFDDLTPLHFSEVERRLQLLREYEAAGKFTPDIS